MAEIIVEFFRNLFGNDIITIFFVSAIPFVELRGAILIGIGGEMALNPFLVWGLSWLGSTLLGVLLYFILNPVLKLLKKIKWFKRFVEKVERIIHEKTEKIGIKAEGVDNIRRKNKIKTLGVCSFIAIPLPLTGTWTGTAIAVFLNMSFRNTMIAVALGNFIASTIIFVLGSLFSAYIDIILYALCALILLVIIFYVIKFVKKDPPKENDDHKE